jgi:hypothetical protein
MSDLEVQAWECDQCGCTYPFNTCKCKSKTLTKVTFFMCSECGETYNDQGNAFRCCSLETWEKNLEFCKKGLENQTDEKGKERWKSLVNTAKRKVAKLQRGAK